MVEMNKSVFISYRRDVSAFIARSIFMDLRSNGYDVFMDVETIDSGEFDSIILNQIAARGHFLVILTIGSLERCLDPADWLRREIEYAIQLKRNIVPILVNNFSFTAYDEHLTGSLENLKRYNSLNLPHDYFDAGMEKLRNRFLRPVQVSVHPTSFEEQKFVQQKIAEVASEPPTQAQIDSEIHLHRGIRQFAIEGNLSSAIEEYTQAINKNNYNTIAYYYRGIAYEQASNIESAIADYERYLKTSTADSKGNLINRSEAEQRLASLKIALQKEIETLNEVEPLSNANEYFKRGNEKMAQGNYIEAIKDYDKAINLNPQNPIIYHNRGIAKWRRFDPIGKHEDTIGDFIESFTLLSANIIPDRSADHLSPKRKEPILRLSRDQFKRIQFELSRLFGHIKAYFIGLIDSEGNMIGAVGTLEEQYLKSLVQALSKEYSTQNSLLSLLQESRFQSSYFESDDFSIYIIEFGTSFAITLAVICSTAVKSGMVWLYSKRTANIIDEILKSGLKS